jgi:hypothetical protein
MNYKEAITNFKLRITARQEELLTRGGKKRDTARRIPTLIIYH